MTTPAHTIASLAAFFDATNALRARILALNMPRSLSAHFFADAERRGDSGFRCAYLDTASNHTTLTLRPCVRACQDAWTTFITNAHRCDPSLASHTFAYVQGIWGTSVPIRTDHRERPLTIFAKQQRLAFPSSQDCLAHFYAHFVQAVINSDLEAPCIVPLDKVGA